MVKYSNLNSVMESGDHFKNGASPKSHMSKRMFLLFCILLFALGNVTAQSIRLDKTKLELIIGEEQQLNATTTPAGQSVTWTSSDRNKAEVEGSYGNAKIIAKAAGTVHINATYAGQTVSCTVTIYDVFLQTGVTIEGVTWAAFNVDRPGTFTAKASDAGMLYQWNKIIGWSTTDPITSFPAGHSWDSSFPSGTTWETANDPCPAGWRVPTIEELNKQRGPTVRWEETTVNGKTGRKIGKENSTIFLPYAGHRIGTGRNSGNLNRGGIYWSSTEDGPNGAHLIILVIGWMDKDRSNALSVRCVKNSQGLTYMGNAQHSTVFQNNNIIESTGNETRTAEEIRKELESLWNLGVIYYNQGVEQLNIAYQIDEVKKHTEEKEKAEDLLRKALPLFENAFKLDPSINETKIALRQTYYALGAIYYNQGVAQSNIVNQIADMTKYTEEREKVLELFRKALPFLENAFKLDPSINETKIGLHGIFYQLDMKDEFEEMSKLLGE